MNAEFRGARHDKHVEVSDIINVVNDFAFDLGPIEEVDMASLDNAWIARSATDVVEKALETFME